jgi:NAD(P)-dependent dehydrogenase (short-subunit alcohol dehydrogenase family)
MRPEKRLKDVDFDDLLLSFDVNALGMMRLATELEPLLRASRAPRFVTLSARVGSIADNRLGGWYAYRASKAALNMLLRTLSIEWSRSMPKLICVALHPGTVSTALSAPYVATNRTRRLFTPAEAAENLLGVIEELEPEDSGGFYAWDGKEVPW